MCSNSTTHLNNQLAQTLQKGVAQKIFSGAQASWCINDSPIQTVVAGSTQYEQGSAITQRTLFDIASLTKVFTTTTTLRLVDQKKIQLSSKIWGNFLVEQLLAHESGLPAWKPFFEDIALSHRGLPKGYEQIISDVLATLPASPAPTQAVYSDIGFMGLGHKLQEITGISLATLVAQQIITPLKMKHTSYCPANNEATNDIASTEACPWRKKILQGEVHDDNAWAMGGVAGHAGIFSTSFDMTTLGRAWRDALKRDGIVSTSIARQATIRRDGGRGLGFDLKTPGASSIGVSASDQTFGHLGFTGTSLWIDPMRDAVICLLTNRVHPSRDNTKIRQFRPLFHELFFGQI